MGIYGPQVFILMLYFDLFDVVFCKLLQQLLCNNLDVCDLCCSCCAMILTFVICVAAVQCRMVPDIANGYMQPLNYSPLHGSLLTIRCHRGYQFSPGVTSVDITCSASGVWSPDIAQLHCLRKSTMLYDAAVAHGEIRFLRTTCV